LNASASLVTAGCINAKTTIPAAARIESKPSGRPPHARKPAWPGALLRMTRAAVRVEMPPSFAHCWLLSHLDSLREKLPNVDIRINAQGSHLQGDRTPFPQLADAPADVQIVYGDSDIWEDRASWLISEVLQPYCAPALLRKHAIEKPEQLVRTMLISTAQNVVSWDEWLNLQGVEIVDSAIGSVQMDPSHLAIRAARNGIGVILESSVLVAKDVEAGSLVPIFSNRTCPGLGYWVYTPSAHGLRPSVAAVRDWLKQVTALAPDPSTP